MEERKLGERGPAVSLVGLGCNNFGMKIDLEGTRAVVEAALEAGITHFDTAEIYGGGHSEEFLGLALGARRDQAFIATKFRPRSDEEPYRPGVLAARIREGCETSLRRLGTDRIDLYYQHRPDPEAPMEETLEALSQLVAEGKVVHLACSNYDGAQLEEADALAEAGADRGLVPFCADQIEWSLLSRAVEAETVPAATRLGLGVVPYFPLASGLLTGKYRRGEPFPEGSRLAFRETFAKGATDENFAYLEALEAFATERGHTLLELAMAWLAAQDGVVSIIAGATTPAQVHANAVAAGWRLTDDDLAELPRRPELG